MTGFSNAKNLIFKIIVFDTSSILQNNKKKAAVTFKDASLSQRREKNKPRFNDTVPLMN